MEEQILDFLKTASPNQIQPYLNSLMSQNFDSFEDFTDFLEDCQPRLSCNENWLTEQIIASCKNCGLYENSCICIRCLLNGNHIQENHQIFIQYGESGSCDCGQSASWNPKGFCKYHHGQHGNPEESLPVELRENFNIIFETLKKFLITEIENKSFTFFNELFEYITAISEMGDGVRRLASLSFSDEKFIQTILSNCFYFTQTQSDSISFFISSYVNDETFSLNFAKLVLPNVKVLISRSFDSCHVDADITNSPPLVGPKSIIGLIFHVFHEFTIDGGVIDFNEYFKNLFLLVSDFIHSNPSLFEGKNGRPFLQFWISKLIIQHYIQRNMIDECRKFYVNLATLFHSIEGYIQPMSMINLLDNYSSYYDYDISHSFVFEFSQLPFYLAKKLPYFSEIIEIFVDFLYRNNDLDHITFLFFLHKIAISTLKNAKNAKEEFDRIIQKHEMFAEIDAKIKNKEEGFDTYKSVYEMIYFRASLIPINVISTVMLRDLGLIKLEDYSKSYLRVTDKYKWSYYSQIDLPFLISLIQFMFSFTEDKNGFLRMIEMHFNPFDSSNSESKEKRLFAFILVVSSLIFSDPKFIGKKKKIVQLYLMTMLRSNPNMPTSHLSFYSGPTDLNRAMRWLKEVKFENNWHIILPFISPDNLLKTILPPILRSMTINNANQQKSRTNEANADAQNNNKQNTSNNNNSSSSNKSGYLLPFPDFVDSDLIDLRSLMRSTFLYAIIYDILYDTKEPILCHYALNLFIILYKNEQLKNTKDERKYESQINAATVDEIAGQIPFNFIDFCDVKINYKRGGSYLSLIDLLESSGPIGLNALNRTYHKRSPSEMKELIKLKSQIKEKKQKIITTYKMNALKFDISTVKNIATDIKAQPNERMFIHVNFILSTIPDFLETRYHFNFSIKNDDDNNGGNDDDDEEEDEIYFSFMKKRNHLKRQLVAYTCGHFTIEKTDVHLCPHCNQQFNYLLPNFNETKDLNLYADVIEKASAFFGDLKYCFKMLKTMIIVLDYRSRLKPEILQDEMTFLLYKNIYILTILLLPGIDSSLFHNPKSKLGHFLIDFVFNYNCDGADFADNFVNNYVVDLDYKIDYEFIKRVELIRLFYINKKLEFIVDIDEHFSFKNLIEMYKLPIECIEPTKFTKYNFYLSKINEVDFDEIEDLKVDFDVDNEVLPAFRGIDLPENFLRIIESPFNIELTARNGQEKLICLATGEIVNRNYLRQNMPIPRELTYQPVLVADGRRINATGIWNLNYFVFCSGIYRNKKGDEDVGFANGDPVFLDHERYIDLIDSFISGFCTKRIQNEKAEVI